MTAPSVAAGPWVESRERAHVLRERYPYAEEVFTLYLALVDVWQVAWAGTHSEHPADVARWASERVLPHVVAASSAAGPQGLVETLRAAPVDDVDAGQAMVRAWLAGEDLDPLETYLARASTRPLLAVVDAAEACADDPTPRGERRCPRCGGPPQLSFRTDTGDQLVSGGRRLLCARCGECWPFSGSACASCGETQGARRTLYAERADGTQVGRRRDEGTTLPHLRVEACTTCRRYVVDVDLGRDPLAVPEVDELVALPLDLHAAEQGMSKVTPNLMGI